MIQEETRKGLWTEQEDFQLMCFVGMFGDRRWDFIAKVSGLNRTGKSCRLRWVNYLHPGLKRGKMTPPEEKIVIELHRKWGNSVKVKGIVTYRWSRIARKLPGRTDNEIKNYWRTHMRKQAQERKRSMSPSSFSSKHGSSPSSTITTDSASPQESGKESFYDTGGNTGTTTMEQVNDGEGQSEKAYSLDDIWAEIALSESNLISPVYGGLTEEGCTFSCPLAGSLFPQYNDSLWQTAEDESKLLFPSSDQLFPLGESDGASSTDYL